MRYKGLLTFEEADKCIAQGHDPDSLVAYRLDGYSVRVYQYDTQWYTESDKVDAKDYQGLAPTLGNPLPMNTVRKDGSWITIQFIEGDYCQCTWPAYDQGDNGEKWFVDSYGGYVDLAQCVGWYPVVTRED